MRCILRARHGPWSKLIHAMVHFPWPYWYISLPVRSLIPSHRPPTTQRLDMANLPPRLRATARVFTPSSDSTVRPPGLRPTAQPFEPAIYLATPRPRPTAPTVELLEYLRLAEVCCQSVDRDLEYEEEGGSKEFEAFIACCEMHIDRYPTLQALRAHIETKPVAQAISRLQDWHPNLDEGIRLLAGWEANGTPNYVGALRAVQEITEKGRTTKQRFPGSILTSPSRELCGRANALSAYVNYIFACDPRGAAADHKPSEERYHGPPSPEWQFFLAAVAHAADAVRQKMISPVVLSVGYAFRDIANRLGCNLGNDLFLMPLLLALRENNGCEASQDAMIPPTCLIDSQTGEQLRDWVIAISQHFKNRPDPYWDGKILKPLRYTSWKGVLND
ncbi:hypothetical protein C8T65DRAFT_728591 [Cerioporus squamosus]|nr:hypothetical protein C8T65DRAFT_728591 [Cerioporus squamosus]